MPRRGPHSAAVCLVALYRSQGERQKAAEVCRVGEEQRTIAEISFNVKNMMPLAKSQVLVNDMLRAFVPLRYLRKRG